MQISCQWQCPRFDGIHIAPIRNNYALIWFWLVYISYLTTLIDLPVCQDIFSKPSLCGAWGYNPTTSNVTNNVLSGISRSWSNRDKKPFVSSKICRIARIIAFKWKLRNDKTFSVGAPLSEITGRPGTVHLICVYVFWEVNKIYLVVFS